MAFTTAAVLTTLAVAGAATAGVGAQRQAESARRAGTRQKGLIRDERLRQAKQEKLIAAQEKGRAEQVGARLRATAGRRGGRRSLISGSETGVAANDNASGQLGSRALLG